MSNLELLDRAANATTCQFLSTFGSALVNASVVPLWTPKGQLVALGAGGLSMLASNYLCPDMPMGGDSPTSQAEGCISMIDGVGQLQFKSNTTGGVWNDAVDSNLYPANDKVVAILQADYTDQGDGKVTTNIRYNTTEGEKGYSQPNVDLVAAESLKWRLRPLTGTCGGDSEDTHPLPPGYDEPIPYTDPITNCNYNVTFQGFAQEGPSLQPNPVWLIEGATGGEREGRNDGGRMGGCNFGPTIYMPQPGGGGGGVNIPVPTPLPDPSDGVPWWAAPLLAGSTSAALQLIGGGLDNLTAPKLPPGEFTLQAPCDVDEEGNPLTQSWTYPEQNFESRSIAHQITILEALQTHLNWKTPICNEKPCLEGRWVTTRWESVEKMAHSGRRLRKLFRYRTKSTRTLGQLSAYWEAFTWESGEVCVFHKGAWWGTPQVWASTEEEGKRVIRFAAAEVGIDPDQVGQWGISSSHSPRYGMSGTMKIQLLDGFPWVSSRNGPDWPNVLAKASFP